MDIPIVKQKDVELFVKKDIVTIRGEINQEKPENFLDPFFDCVISQMGDKLVLDLRELRFLNSSGIKAIISFMLKRKTGSNVIMKANHASSWQRTSLKVLASLDDNISLE